MQPTDIDSLYAAPLDEFTKRRNSLAAELKKGGDSEGAALAKALKKPTLPAWAVNRLARADPDALRELMDMRDRIAAGRGPDEVRDLSRARLELVARLTDRAGELLREAGHSSSPEALRRISQTLQAGTTDSERDLILSGRLTAELSPAAFGGLGEWSAPPARPAAKGAEDPGEAARAEARRRSEELAGAADEAEAEARRLADEVKRAERELKRSRAAADAALERAERARARARAAADDLS